MEANYSKLGLFWEMYEVCLAGLFDLKTGLGISSLHCQNTVTLLS